MKKRYTSLFSGICREIRTTFHKKFAEINAKFHEQNEKNRKFINSIANNSNFAFFSANFWWNFVRISRQIPEKSDVCRFFNRICENKLENCRKFWNLWKLFIIFHYYSFVSLVPPRWSEEEDSRPCRGVRHLDVEAYHRQPRNPNLGLLLDDSTAIRPRDLHDDVPLGWGLLPKDTIE